MQEFVEEMKMDDFGIAVVPVATLPDPLFHRWAFYYFAIKRASVKDKLTSCENKLYLNSLLLK